jgi:hypothetical protein
MAFPNLGWVESKEQAVNAYYVSYADEETACSHRKVSDPERETKRCGRFLGACIGLPDDLEPIPADDDTESQAHEPVEDRHDAPELHGEMFYKQGSPHVSLFLCQSTGGKKDGPDDHVEANFLSPIRGRSEDIPHDDTVKSSSQSSYVEQPKEKSFRLVPSHHKLIRSHNFPLLKRGSTVTPVREASPLPDG